MTSDNNLPAQNRKQNRHEIERTIYQKLKEDYNPTDKDYYSTVIKSIIYNETCHIVALFKENLLLDDNSEFLKRFYSNEESNNRLTKLIDYYDNYSKIYPNYNVIDEGKYFYRNIQRKQRMIDLQEEIEREEKDKKPLDTSIDLFNTEVYESIINDKNNEDIELMFGKVESCKEEPDIIKAIEGIINEIDISSIRNNDYNHEDNEVNDNCKNRSDNNKDQIGRDKEKGKDNQSNSNIKLAKNTVIVTNIKKRHVSNIILENKQKEDHKRTNELSNDSKGKTERIVLDKIDLSCFIKKFHHRNNSGNNSNNNSKVKSLNKIDLRFGYLIKEPMTFRFHHSNIISGINKPSTQNHQQHNQQSCNTSRIHPHKSIPFQKQMNGRNISSRNIDTIIYSKINRSTLNGSVNNIHNHSQFKTKPRNETKNQTKNSIFESSTDNYLMKFSKDNLSINNINHDYKLHPQPNNNISSKYQRINKEQFSLGKFIHKTMSMINSSTKNSSKSRDIKKSIEEPSKLNVEHNTGSSSMGKMPQKPFYPKRHCNISNAMKGIHINNFSKAFEFQASIFSHSERARKESSEIEKNPLKKKSIK